MNGLETLKAIGAGEIFRRTHISVDEAKALLEKNFDYFNRAKALGFVKILEREYDVDLSEWVAEFEEHKGRAQENGAIFVYPKEEQNRSLSVGLAALVVAAIALGALFYFGGDEEKTVTAPQAQNNKSALVEEAKEAISAAATVEVLTPIEPAQPEEPVAETAPEFYISSESDLWVGIYYSDTGQRDGRIIKGRIDLDPERNQIITFGHGMFKMVYQDQVIEPNSGGLQRFRFRDGELTQMAAPQPAKPQSDNNESAEGTVQP